MKSIAAIFLFFTAVFGAVPNKPVDRIDLNRFAGKWYSLYSIPTFFDSGSRETTTTYTLNKDSYYNVLTCYKKGDDEKMHTYHSKLFPGEGNGEMKAQFIWPYKADYWVIELADDYSYVVVGHPDHRFLFIMSRKSGMNKDIYDGIVARCKAKGYAVEKLTSQNHHD